MYTTDFLVDQQEVLIKGTVYREVSSCSMKAEDIPRSRSFEDLSSQRSPDVYYDVRKILAPSLHRKLYPNEA